jgi:hypothetical protein
MTVDEQFERAARLRDLVRLAPEFDVSSGLPDHSMTACLDLRVPTKADADGLDVRPRWFWRGPGHPSFGENPASSFGCEAVTWQDTVERHWADESNVDDYGVDMADLIGLLSREIERAVADTLADRSPEPARRLVVRVTEADLLATAEGDGRDGAIGSSISFLVLAGWLRPVRDEHPGAAVADDILGWVRAELGASHADVAGRATGILGAADAPSPSLRQLTDDLGDDLLPALVWLAAGAVMCCGNGEIAWLRRHDHGHTAGE